MKNMIFHKLLTLLVYTAGFIIAITYSQYTDDADYNDIDIYEDLSPNYKSTDKAYNSENHDDFYISEELKNSAKSMNIPQQTTNSYKIVEKIYRYTKHRIPGYDYDELNFTVDKNSPRCDSKSIWTHCLCQFTCDKPSKVDCYTPCYSGCECKEKYVFDENTQQCIYPEYCRTDNDNDIL